MLKGRAIIESSTFEGVVYLIDSIKAEFPMVQWTEPVQSPDGRFFSSVHYSNEIIQVGSNVDCL